MCDAPTLSGASHHRPDWTHNILDIMPKIKECASCQFYSHDPHVVCAVHPTGPDDDTCLDFREDPELESKQFVDFLGIGS